MTYLGIYVVLESLDWYISSGIFNGCPYLSCSLRVHIMNLERSVTYPIHTQWGSNLSSAGVNGVAGSQLSEIYAYWFVVELLEQPIITGKYIECKSLQIVFNRIYVYHTCQDKIHLHSLSLQASIEHDSHHCRTINTLY